jgi:hypothetical protein
MYNARMLKRFLKGLVGLVVLAALPFSLGCRSREVEKDLKIVDVHTGWYDVGIIEGKTKMVPSVAFKLQNVSQEPISRVQLNAVFRRVKETESWGDQYAVGIGPEGLAPGASGKEIVLRSNFGATSPDQSRAEMLADRRFVDARVEVFGKHGSRNWVKMGEFNIERRLLTATN